MKSGDRVVIKNTGTEHDGKEGQYIYLRDNGHHMVMLGYSTFAVQTENLELVREHKSEGGTKHDGDKPDLSMLPFKSLEQVARVLQFGAKKYGRGNWKKGFKEERLVAAALRHIGAFADGEREDGESGLSHLAHAACNLLFVLWFIETKSEMKE